MTTDPERLLGPHGDATELERELLDSVRDAAPKGDAKAVAWSGIAARLAAASVVGAGAVASTSAAAAPATTSAAAASGTSVAAAATSAGGAGLVGSGLLTKVVLAVAVTGGAVGGGIFLKQSVGAGDAAPLVTSRAPEAPAASVTSEQGTPAGATRAEASGEPEPSAPRVAEAFPAPAAPARAQKRRAGTPAEMLEAESGLLTAARAALRSGDTEGAARTLERLRTEFPAGVLVQEREVLAIELLAERGETALARQRAERFIRAHPTSPHSAALRRLLAKP